MVQKTVVSPPMVGIGVGRILFFGALADGRGAGASLRGNSLGAAVGLEHAAEAGDMAFPASLLPQEPMDATQAPAHFARHVLAYVTLSAEQTGSSMNGQMQSVARVQGVTQMPICLLTLSP